MLPAPFRSHFRESIAIIVLVLAFFSLTLFCQYRTAGLQVYLEVEAEQDDMLQIFWRGADEPFQQKQSWHTGIRGGEITSIATTLPVASAIDYVRIDPGTQPGFFRFTSALLSFGEQEHVDMLIAVGDSSPTLLNQLHIISRDQDVLLESLGIDPFFVIHAPITAKLIFHWKLIVPALLFSCLLLYLLMHQRLLKGSKRSGRLYVSLPDHVMLTIPPSQDNYRLRPRMTCSKSSGSRTYSLEVTNIETLSVADLLTTFKSCNDAAELRFQFRRSADV